MAPTPRIQTLAQRAGRLKTCITRVIDGSKQVLEYVDQWEADRKAACQAAEHENRGHPIPDLAVTTDALNTLISMETQLEGLPQILQVKAAKLVEEAEENNEEWEELENLCKLAVEEREDQRKHLLIAVKSKIEMFREIHEASEEVVPPPPLSPQQVLHIMAESIDAPNQEPVVTSPMKYPLYHELHMANSTGMIGNNSELSPETHQLPERIQDLNLNGTLEKQTTAADTPILNSNCHINPELGGLPTGNIVYQPVNMRQKGRQNINENSNYPAAAGFSHRI
ncbi:hypothetical protein CRE_01468 [Caenorhabditis remanei]|uniref:Uncharacterized protein n=1 Tax=Caenorhabditis remanei TaxID=31234 RepID=E3NPG4_CAERE|nr:hypothetical protein CRE_01468 [Caenorhabditis remanei]